MKSFLLLLCIFLFPLTVFAQSDDAMTPEERLQELRLQAKQEKERVRKMEQELRKRIKANAETAPPAAPPSEPATATTPPRQPTATALRAKRCEIALPDVFEVQAVGVLSGYSNTDITLEGSPIRAKRQRVVVNRPGKNTLLLLMAEYPTIWVVERQKDSRVVGVYLWGNQPQVIEAIESHIPVSISTERGKRRDCENFSYGFETGPALAKPNQHIKAITGKAINGFWGKIPSDTIFVGATPR
jgi:peptidoglycan hydrolase-like protein with peptidoglycan-binding domain